MFHIIPILCLFLFVGFVEYRLNKHLDDIVEFNEEGKLELNDFGAVLGMFIYDEKFQAPYTRIGKDNLWYWHT